jgi:outer membrane protein TolC
MRLGIKLAISGAVLAITMTSASAQITFSSAIDLALHGDPRIKAAQADVDKARAVLASTHDAYVPTISANGGEGASVGVPLSVPIVFSLASQSLLFNFSQKDNVRAAASGVESASLALQETRDKVAEDVTLTYLNLSNAQQRAIAMAQEDQYARRLADIVGDRVTAGLDTRIDLLHARRTVKEIDLQRLETEDEIANLSNHLARLVGLPGNQLEAVTGSIPPLPPIQSVTAAAAPESYGVLAALAAARSKQEIAFGEARYRFRPQIILGANYARISLKGTDFTDYYPGFLSKSEDAASIGLSITFPLLDRAHQDHAHEAAADARRARFDAEDQRDQFLEGRFKLQHSAAELAARSDLAQIDRDLAQEQLNVILLQLTAASGADASPDKPQLTPKDEQNARLQERARTVDLLNAQFQLTQLQVNLLRQTGQLDAWLKTQVTAPPDVYPAPTHP